MEAEDLSSSTCNQNLTIPSEHGDNIITATAHGKIYKFGLTLEELFNLSLEYYKKG